MSYVTSRFRPLALLAISALCIALAQFHPMPAFAQEQDRIRELISSAVDLLGKGQEEAALERVQQALQRAQRLRPPDPAFAAGIAGMNVEMLNELGTSRLRTGPVSDAEMMFRQALALTRQYNLKLDTLLRALNHHGIALRHTGNYPEAEAAFNEAIDLRQRQLPGDRVGLANVMENLAYVYSNQDNLPKAESLLRDVLRIREIALKPGDPKIAQTMGNLGDVLSRSAQHDLAIGLLRRADTMMSASVGRGGRMAVIVRYNLAVALGRAGRDDEAAPLLKEVLAAIDSVQDYRMQQRVLDALSRATLGKEESLGYAKQALDLKRRLLPAGHPDIADGQYAVALSLALLNRWKEAQAIILDAAGQLGERLGRKHPRVLRMLETHAGMTAASGNFADGYPMLKNIADALIETASARGGELSTSKADAHDFGGLAGRRDDLFGTVVEAAWELQKREPARLLELAAEAFFYLQFQDSSRSSEALDQLAARFRRGSDEVASVVRSRQDAIARWQLLANRQLLLAAADQAGSEQERRALDAELAVLADRITSFERTLADRSPRGADLIMRRAVTVDEVRRTLNPGEALVVFSEAEIAGMFAFVVTHDRLIWRAVQTNARKLSEDVRALRCGLDHTSWRGEGGAACQRMLSTSFNLEDYRSGKSLPFDPARAHGLYKTLFEGIEDALRGKELLIVAAGQLAQLPLQVLVTAPVEPGGDLAQIQWLIRRHAMTTLPAVASLRALRRETKASSATRPLIGFGNPLLDGDQADPIDGAHFKRRAEQARLRIGCAITNDTRTISLRSLRRSATPILLRGGLADLAHLRIQTPLPETADELCLVARSVGADPAHVHLGARASEGRIKHLSAIGELAQYRMLHFATHGLLAGQLAGTREPGLVLSPPATATADDDGYLSAVEITSLRLDADWVVLSACNTAGSDGGLETAEALSGLARAFFYAGARAILVSHWEVDSAATVDLIAAAIGALAKEPGIGRSEALRRAMLAVMADARRPPGWMPAAHPSVWAPFVVVGEGGAAAR